MRTRYSALLKDLFPLKTYLQDGKLVARIELHFFPICAPFGDLVRSRLRPTERLTVAELAWISKMLATVALTTA